MAGRPRNDRGGVAGRIMRGGGIEDMLRENRAGYRAAKARLEAERMGRTAVLR